MTTHGSRRRTIAALAVGIATGAAASAGTALLLYTGQGFLRAAGLLVSSTMMAVAAGLWAGAPEPGHGIRTRPRWIACAAALLAGGIFAGAWGAREPLRELALGGAFAVLLALALPAYAAGALLAGLHARDRSAVPGFGAVAAGGMAGSALGVLLATAFLIQSFEPAAIYFGVAALVAGASLLDVHAADGIRRGEANMVDRVVIVTGASDRGQLGFTVARRLLERGARVVVSARSERLDDAAAELAAAGDVLAVRADLGSDDDVARLVDTVRSRLGRIDALVNIAGGLSVIASIEDTTPEQWQQEIERNAGTALRLSRAALPLLRESRGVIVNFTSPAALRAPARLGAYSAAKAAVSALTRSLAVEEKQHGVRVNAVAPGTMDTRQNIESMGEDSAFVTREQVADVVLFLLSDAAAGITGETIGVPGATIR